MTLNEYCLDCAGKGVIKYGSSLISLTCMSIFVSALIELPVLFARIVIVYTAAPSAATQTQRGPLEAAA